jgi:hypothetical protein
MCRARKLFVGYHTAFSLLLFSLQMEVQVPTLSIKELLESPRM